MNNFKITVCASGGGGNFEFLVMKQKLFDYKINLLIVDRDCGAIHKAKKYDLPCLFLNKSELRDQFFNKMNESIPADTNLIVLAGFMPILDSFIISKWEGKIINTHPSLLPKYGGKGMYGVKVQEAVMSAREEYAGCTVHFVNNMIDGGDIILQRRIKVNYSETPWQLGGRIFAEENILLVEAVRLLKSKLLTQK